MGIKIKVIIIVGLSVLCNLCTPVKSDGQNQNTTSLASEEDEIQVSTKNLTFPALEKTPLSVLKNTEFNETLSHHTAENSIQDNGVLVEDEEATALPANDGDLIDDLENWIAPLYIQQTFSYILAGYDESSRPIYIVRLGNMDIRSVVDRGAEAQEAALKYILQTQNTILKDMAELRTEDGKPVTRLSLLVDFGGLTLRQLSPHNIAFLLKVVLRVRDFVEEHMGECYVVNVNFVAGQFVQVFRPVLGKTLERMTLLGTNPKKWKPIIRRTFGPENLPEYYGGNTNWQPVKYCGAR